ncbi:MAG: UDP-N-acetyl glucosamine 2-epimerase [Myxococcales bacterium]
MRRVAVLTTSRADYGLLRPVMRAIVAAPDLELLPVVAGMHLVPELGHTHRAIEEDGFVAVETVEMLLASDTGRGVAKSIGVGILGYADAWARLRPDLLVVLGDRFEVLAAAVSALPLRLPVAHIHGGEVTRGAIDEQARHALTKLSHLHFVAAEEFRRRVLQMGEEPWRVIVSGAPGLDELLGNATLSREELGAFLGMDLREPPLLVTWHPPTLEEPTAAVAQAVVLVASLEVLGVPCVVTAPNADAGGRAVADVLRSFVARAPERRCFVESLGSCRYASLMRHAAAMVGNSSSGLLEAPSFGLPAVNVGSRQEGRLRGRNVIDAAPTTDAIGAAIARALDPTFRAALAGAPNPYGDGHAAERIVAALTTVELGPTLLRKGFADLEFPG